MKFSRAQQIILEQFGRPPLVHPLAGDTILPGQINAALMQALREGIEHEACMRGLVQLEKDGYLAVKGDSIMLTAQGAAAINLV
jgi:hypothetical protein